MAAIDQFDVTCTNAGQVYALSADDLVLRGFNIVAKTTNVDAIIYGRVGVSSTAGLPLYKGDMKIFASRIGGYNLKYFYVVALSGGDKVTVIPE